MLYDILPPLSFFISFAGVIAVVSRIVLRKRREQFSHDVQRQGAATRQAHAGRILRPGAAGIRLVQDRAALFVQHLRDWRSRTAQVAKAAKVRLRSIEIKRAVQKDESVKDTQVHVDVPEKPVVPVLTRVIAQAAPVLKKKKKPSVIQQAQEAIEKGRYTAAEDILVPYIAGHTKDVHAYILLGRAAQARGQWSEAVEIYQQVLKLDDTQKGVYATLGVAAMKAGKLTLALQNLQRAHEEDPTNVRILQRLLKISQRMDNRALQKAVKSEIQKIQQQEQA